jgi:hypothetical protein
MNSRPFSRRKMLLPSVPSTGQCFFFDRLQPFAFWRCAGRFALPQDTNVDYPTPGSGLPQHNHTDIPRAIGGSAQIKLMQFTAF